MLLLGSVEASAFSSYLTGFNAAYGTAGTRLDSCTVCHNSSSGGSRNSYGNDYNGSFPANDTRDSDNDGFTNTEEIDALTFPGNASDVPQTQPPPNQAPTANAGPNQTVTAGSGGTASVTLNGNGSSDPDGETLTYSWTWSSGGSASGVSPTVSLSAGSYNITLSVSDGNGGSDTDIVVVTVNAFTPANTAPVAVNDSYSVDAGATLGVTAPGVLGNDTDQDNDPLTAVLASGPSSGTFNLSSNGTFTYTPTISNGQVTFTYRANDGTVNSNNTATVTITVNAVTPGNTPPRADNKAVTTDVDTPVAVTLTGSDADGDSLTFAVVAGPANGALSGTAPNLTYTPAAGYSGPDSFTYNANDGTDGSNTATVTITVNAATPGNTAPVADDKAVTTNEGTPVAVTLTGSDADGDSLTYAVVAGPANGALSGTAPNLTYTPAAGYSGPDSFTYNANDGTDGSNTATVTITVDAVTPPPTGDGDLTVSPVDGAADIGVSTAVMMTLNEFDGFSSVSDPSDIRTIVNEDTFTLRVNSPVNEASWRDWWNRDDDDDNDEHTQCVTNGFVNGNIDYNGSNTEAVFTPDCRLANNTTYTATVILQGADPLTWSFTTIATTPDSDDDGVEDGEDDEADDDKEATPPKSKGKGKFRYRLRNHDRAYLRKVSGISDSHYSINQTGKPVGYDFQDGLVGAEIHDVAPGETVDVELTFPEAIPEGSKAYMSDADGFKEVPAVISGDTVTLTLSAADVGNGDIPPIGVAVPNATGDGSIGVATDAAGGGCSVVGGGGGWKEAAGSYGLLTLVWLGLALRRRKPETGR
jgi:hypothetical protein